MRRGVSILGSILSVVLCGVLAACGTTSGSSSGNGGSTNATMQAGQWEFAVTPTNGDPKYFVEANLTDSGNGIFSAPVNTTDYCYGGTEDSGVTVNGTIEGDALTGSVAVANGGPTVPISATIASGGKSVSQGTIGSGLDCVEYSWQLGSNNNNSGTFTGYTVAPANGTFAGTLTSSMYGPDVVTVNISQDANFGITVSGTSLENAVTTNLSISPAGAMLGVNEIVGAQIQAQGTATNLNGSQQFQAIGQLNAAGTQITIIVTELETGEQQKGTLTKQ